MNQNKFLQTLFETKQSLQKIVVSLITDDQTSPPLELIDNHLGDCACTVSNNEEEFEKSDGLKKPKIFISYASEDKKIVCNLYQNLKELGFDPWMDTENLLPGEKWDYTINQAVKKSDFFLVCLSNNSVDKRGFLQKELKKGLEILEEFPEGKIFLIPIRIEDCSIPESIKGIQYFDLFRENGLEKLNDAIRSQIKNLTHHNINNMKESKKANGIPMSKIDHLKFINRIQELDMIGNPGGPSLMVIDAPLGYGKTSLLKETLAWYKTKKLEEWLCALIDLNEERYINICQFILDGIAEQTIKGSIKSGSPIDLINKLIEQKKNILLLFDTVESNPNATKWLQEEFVIPLMKALKNTQNIGRVIFAGRYIQNPERLWQGKTIKWNWRGYYVKELTILDENVVREAIFKELENTNLQSRFKDVLAKEITTLSCGHPGIIQEILKNPPNDSWIWAVQENQLKPEVRISIFQQFVKAVILDILMETKDDNLSEILKILSIFRRFDLNTIQALQNIAENGKTQRNVAQSIYENFGRIEVSDLLTPFQKIQQNAIDVLTKFVNTGLASAPTREKTYYHDAIIRKLLLMQMQIEKSNFYPKYNALAVAIYKTWLDNKNVDGSRLTVPIADQIQADYIANNFYHFLIYLKNLNSVNHVNKIEEMIKWYLERLRSSFGYNKKWLQKNLLETIERDEDIPTMLINLLGENDAQKILEKFISIRA